MTYPKIKPHRFFGYLAEYKRLDRVPVWNRFGPDDRAETVVRIWRPTRDWALKVAEARHARYQRLCRWLEQQWEQG